MIPSALAGQLQQGLADFLRFSFWSSTQGMAHVIEDLLGGGGWVWAAPWGVGGRGGGGGVLVVGALLPP